MARGKTRGHKGGRKQFSNPDQIKDDMAKAEEKRLWREQHPDSSSEESSEEEEKAKTKVSLSCNIRLFSCISQFLSLISSHIK